jgi:hypothetical protein
VLKKNNQTTTKLLTVHKSPSTGVTDVIFEPIELVGVSVINVVVVVIVVVVGRGAVVVGLSVGVVGDVAIVVTVVSTVLLLHNNNNKHCRQTQIYQ